MIAAKNSPRLPARSQKKSRCERVSRVVPDLEAATKSVASRSSDSARRRMAAGCVVSSTWKDSAPKLRLITSGARLEPPIPSRTKVSICPGAASSSTKRCRSPSRLRIRIGSSSQPSHLASSLPVQSVGSRSQIRATSSAGATALIRPPAGTAARARRTRVAAPCSARAPSRRSLPSARPGISRASRSAIACMSGWSSSPTRTSVGTCTSPSRRGRSSTSSSSSSSATSRWSS